MNRTTILGNLVADPTFGVTKNGLRVANFKVAENYVTKTGEERVSYVKVSLWDARSTLANNLRKGDKVFLEGRMTAEAYQGGDGQWRASLMMVDPKLEYCSPKRAQDQAVGAADEERPY